jgi:hypothetical protein
MSLIAIGLCLMLAVGRHYAFAACWGVIAASWFGISMWLWRKTIVAYDNS